MPTSRQRREAERRRAERQLRRRAQREARRRRMLVLVSILGLLAVVAVVVGFVVMTSNDDKKPAAKHSTSPASAPTSSTSSTAAPAAYPCTWTKGGTAARKVSVPSTTKPPRTGTVKVSVRTNHGAMTFTLNRAKAPCAVASFLSLAAQHYFDHTTCHRLTSGTLSVVQCGDPTGTGQGGPGYTFRDELTGKEKYTRGVLAMANAGANTNGSQFFVVYKDSQLQPQYTVFGKVTTGLSVVDRVAARGSQPAGDGKPKLSLSLTKVALAR